MGSEDKKTIGRNDVTSELLQQLISEDKSFEITGLDAEGAMTEMIERVEKTIESQNKTCRVYTAGRSAVVAAAAIPTGVTQLTGAAAMIGIGLHNFATYNPDYEIAKHLLDKKLSVNKKEVTLENGKKKSRWSLLGDIVIAGAGAIANAATNAAEKNVMQNGSKEEIESFKKQKEIFNQQRQKTRAVFEHFTKNHNSAGEQADRPQGKQDDTEKISKTCLRDAVIGDSEFENRYDLTEMVIPNGVTAIGHHAFNGCRGLVRVVIPDGVTNIGANAFSGCERLTDVVMPNSVTTVGAAAFEECCNLTKVIISKGVKTISERAFLGCKSLTNVIIPDGVTTIGDRAFDGCEKLATVVIPDSVETIGDEAFSGCENLPDMIIPKSVTTIGDYAFCDCKKLTNVVIPDGVTTISGGTFSGCENLIDMIIPKGVTTIGDSAFRDCKKLTDVVIPDGVTTVGDEVFKGCQSLTNATIPDGVTTIGYCAFHGCEKLTKVVVPDSIETIGDKAFSGCDSLTDVVMPNSVKTIGDDAFRGCGKIYVPSSLKYCFEADGALIDRTTETLLHFPNDFSGTYEIPPHIKIIGRYAFERCKRLVRVVIPDGVTNIGANAFSGCDSLTDVIIPKSVTTIGHYAFDGCKNLKCMVIPENVKSIADTAFCGCGRVDISGSRSYSYYTDADGALICGATRKLLHMSNEFSGTYEIPQSIMIVGAHAFSGCEKLTGVIIPSGVKTIDNYAFYGCSTLKFVEIPDSIEKLGGFLFRGCKNLSDVAIPMQNNIRNIGSIRNIDITVFDDCPIEDQLKQKYRSLIWNWYDDKDDEEEE